MKKSRKKDHLSKFHPEDLDRLKRCLKANGLDPDKLTPRNGSTHLDLRVGNRILHFVDRRGGSIARVVLNSEGRITTLDSSHIRLSEELFQFPHLKEIDVKHRGPFTIPDDMACTGLERFIVKDLGNARLENLEVLKRLENLRELSVDFPIGTFRLSDFKRLESLVLKHSEVHIDTVGVLTGFRFEDCTVYIDPDLVFHKVDDLDFIRCDIRSIGKTMSSQFPNLEMLVLEELTLPEGWCDLDRMTKIYMLYLKKVNLPEFESLENLPLGNSNYVTFSYLPWKRFPRIRPSARNVDVFGMDDVELPEGLFRCSACPQVHTELDREKVRDK
ncbi:MAG: hypothetical protein D6698_16890, partial [Gammaproteobacteria bacterium]